ncbi:hypothetical protein GF357_02365 [Candidatus Dojkabacteria bacterium]|nr:hypothetical protein [Candidatus Dojkabacteria bacterium]
MNITAQRYNSGRSQFVKLTLFSVFVTSLLLIGLTAGVSAPFSVSADSSRNVEADDSSLEGLTFSEGVNRDDLIAQGLDFGELKVVDSGSVLAAGDENDACRDSNCGCVDCVVTGDSLSPLCSDGSFTVNFPKGSKESYVEIGINKITHDNQVTAGLDYNNGRDSSYPIVFNSDLCKVMINYPPRSRAYDIYQQKFNPVEISEGGTYYGLFHPNENFCGDDSGGDSGPYSVKAKVSVAAPIQGSSGSGEVLVTMYDNLSKTLGKPEIDINPDNVNKIGAILWQKFSPPSAEFGGRNYAPEICPNKNPEMRVIPVPADNYIACVGESCDEQNDIPKLITGRVALTDAEYESCLKSNSTYCAKEFGLTFELGAPSGSNQYCEAGHCMDAADDKMLAVLMNPVQLQDYLDTSTTATEQELIENNDVLIRDVYSATNCDLDIDGGSGGGIACIHPGPSYAQAHLYRWMLSMPPTEVSIDEEVCSSLSNYDDIEEIFWSVVREYWNAQGDLCR